MPAAGNEKKMKKLTINRWAAEDRPREKMMLKGAEALSDAELLAILIGSGNTEESAVALMQRTLACCNNDLNQLGKWEVHDFSRFKGIGPAKSVTIMAALELGKRRNRQERSERVAIHSSDDIYGIFHPLLCDLTVEEFWVLLLNQASRVIDKVRISPGRHRPDQRRCEEHPTRSPAATRHTDCPDTQPPLRKSAAQHERPPTDTAHTERSTDHEHPPHRPRYSHRRQILQFYR